MRRCTVLCLLALVLSSAAPAAAHDPGSDGGSSQRGCGAMSGLSRYGTVGVGATRTSCSIARTVASGSVRGTRFERWRCTGVGTRFGHCHGRGIRRGAVVHWYAYH